MISLFIKTRREQIFSGVLVLACMAAVFWIRMLPLSLPVTEELAEKIVGRDLRGQLARELEKKYPGGEWRGGPPPPARGGDYCPPGGGGGGGRGGGGGGPKPPRGPGGRGGRHDPPPRFVRLLPAPAGP